MQYRNFLKVTKKFVLNYQISKNNDKFELECENLVYGANAREIKKQKTAISLKNKISPQKI